MLVLFDLDGTLTDPYEGITKCVAHALHQSGLARLDEWALRSFVGPPLQDQFASLGLDAEGVRRAVLLYRERYTQQGLYENYVYDGIKEALGALSAASVRMAVATSKPTEFATRIVEHFDIAPHFALVAGATLDGTRRKKGDVIGFALASLGAGREDAVMVGDRAQDIDGARAHGIRSIGVTWGYAEPGELERAGPDLIVRSPQELVESLLR